MKDPLISKESLNAYLKRLNEMRALKFSEEGDQKFITKIKAFSEQVDNLHVKARVNEGVLENDEPKELGGGGKFINPMESLLASIANCLELIALTYFSFFNLQIEDIKVGVEGIYDKRSMLKDKKAPSSGFYKISYKWYIRTNEKRKKVLKVLKQIERTCPVKATIEKEQNINGRLKILDDS